MSDRKYRQHGYQDDDRDRRPRDGNGGEYRRPEREPGAPAGTRRMSSEGAKNPRMMGYRSIAKCARCGAPVDSEILTLSKCEKCGQSLHACIQCVNFDPSAPFECSERIPARVSPKDAANECSIFTARASWERATTSTPAPAVPTASGMPESVTDAKKAFEDLFKI
jgi:DNA-directed RNA polymerase subunit RPC12/RpoP